MKKRYRLTTHKCDVPHFQYQPVGDSGWTDAPRFILTWHELKAYLRGKGCYSAQARKITEYYATTGVL